MRKRILESLFFAFLICCSAMIFATYLASFVFRDLIAINPNGLETNVNDIFAFGGVLVTILAFVSTFFILVMAVDAFSIGRSVELNRDGNNRNSQDIKELNKSIKELEQSSAILGIREGLIVDVVEELNEVYETNDHFFGLFEMIAAKEQNDDPVWDKSILSRREDFRIRRARINALTVLLDFSLKKDVAHRVEQIWPELKNAADEGDGRSRELAEKFKSSNLI